MSEEREQRSGIRDQESKDQESRDQGFEVGESLEPMTEFELEVARAMRCVEAPSGLAERVMARAAAGERPFVAADRKAARGKVLMMSHQWRAWASGAIAALIVLGVLQGERVHQQHVRQTAAQQQFEAAQRITDQTLAHVREQVQQAISLQE